MSRLTPDSIDTRASLHHQADVAPCAARRGLPDWRDCCAPAYPALSSADENHLIERGEQGSGDVLLVSMGAGSGTACIDEHSSRWALTPSLGICQAVLIVSCSDQGAGRVSLTHFCPADHEAHASALKELFALHAEGGFARHAVCYAFPRDDYSGRYRAPLRAQGELRELLARQAYILPSPDVRTLFYHHAPYEEAGRSALIAHTFSHQGARALVIDLFGNAPQRIW